MHLRFASPQDPESLPQYHVTINVSFCLKDRFQSHDI